MRMCHSQSKYGGRVGQLPKQRLILSNLIYTCYTLTLQDICLKYFDHKTNTFEPKSSFNMNSFDQQNEFPFESGNIYISSVSR